MIAGLKPYSAMRDSGVPWLGRVPEHWEVRRNGRLFAQRNETGFPELPILEVSLRTGVRIRDFESSHRKQVMSEKEKYKRARRADIAYNMMRMWQGAVGFAPIDGLVSPAYVVAKPLPGTESRYFEFLFRTNAYMAEVNNYSRGIVSDRNRLYWDEFKQIPSPYPPIDEQAAIVRFLNHADRLIRRYIRSKQNLIELLEEQKLAIIHRAVTRGLDPNARLKHSGMKWLGDVPEHWEVMALRLRYRQCLGKMLDSKRVRGLDSLPYLRNTDVQWDRINTLDLPVMDIAPSEYGRYTVKPGDLLICEGGEVGRCAIWNGDLEVCGFQKALHRLRPLSVDHDIPRFLYYVLRVATQAGAFDDGHESTIAHLTGDKLRAHRFVFPPKTEQVAIVAYLDNATRDVNQGGAGAQREIDLLREYRARLIADVVTGKQDVRAAAANLPNAADEPELLDENEALAESDEDLADVKLDASTEQAEA